MAKNQVNDSDDHGFGCQFYGLEWSPQLQHHLTSRQSNEQAIMNSWRSMPERIRLAIGKSSSAFVRYLALNR